MMYFIKTAHGISEAFYKVTKQYLLFWTGQVSSALPAIWLTIVVCLLSGLMSNYGSNGNVFYGSFGWYHWWTKCWLLHSTHH
jgi:hypothetical protein